MLKIILIILIGVTANVSAMPMPINIDCPYITVVQVFAETGINISEPLKTIEDAERLHGDSLGYLLTFEEIEWYTIIQNFEQSPIRIQHRLWQKIMYDLHLKLLNFLKRLETS
jgi:hypothetical protein